MKDDRSVTERLSYLQSNNTLNNVYIINGYQCPLLLKVKLSSVCVARELQQKICIFIFSFHFLTLCYSCSNYDNFLLLSIFFLLINLYLSSFSLAFIHHLKGFLFFSKILIILIMFFKVETRFSYSTFLLYAVFTANILKRKHESLS